MRQRLSPQGQLPHLRKSKVTVQQPLDDTIAVWAKGQYLQVALLPASGGAAAAPAVGLRPPSGVAAPEAGLPPQPVLHKPRGHKPASDHPWNNPNTEAYLFGR